MPQQEFRVPTDYASIHTALEAASKCGGTVLLAPGVYREGSVLSLRAGVSLIGSGAENCVIESGSHTTLFCSEGAESISGLCVRQV